MKYVLSNQSDKPFLISEFYNLQCGTHELEEFLAYIDGYYQGMIGHYLGRTKEEYDTTLVVEYIHYKFLKFFVKNNPNI